VYNLLAGQKIRPIWLGAIISHLGLPSFGSRGHLGHGRFVNLESRKAVDDDSSFLAVVVAERLPLAKLSDDLFEFCDPSTKVLGFYHGRIVRIPSFVDFIYA
jgi:hypothetical protein